MPMKCIFVTVCVAFDSAQKCGAPKIMHQYVCDAICFHHSQEFLLNKLKTSAQHNTGGFGGLCILSFMRLHKYNLKTEDFSKSKQVEK